MPTRHSDHLLLIAARNPVAGETKTRLGATIGMSCAAQLYRAFLHDLAGRFASDAVTYDVGWAYTPESHPFHAIISAIRPDIDVDRTHFVRQEGGDWAIRQASLLRWGAEQGYAATVLTASDSPHMTRTVVNQAFSALETSDVVLGRVHDGGYYLVGVRGFHDVVSGVPMSTASAATDVMLRAEENGLSVAFVEPTFDVDVESDLDYLVDICRTDPEAAPTTCQALHDLGLMARIAERR